MSLAALIRTLQPVGAVGPASPDIITGTETTTEEVLDVPWNVVVHNDPINLMDYVSKVFMRVFGFPREKAEVHMLEVHEKGRSIVWSGARERAELYVQQLQTYLLTATIEKSQ
jgi:ATP-dependent Clp protease adaptor protein ClpS